MNEVENQNSFQRKYLKMEAVFLEISCDDMMESLFNI